MSSAGLCDCYQVSSLPPWLMAVIIGSSHEENVVCWFVGLPLGVLPVYVTISYNHLAVSAENVHMVRSGKASVGREPGGPGCGAAHTGDRPAVVPTGKSKMLFHQVS